VTQLREQKEQEQLAKEIRNRDPLFDMDDSLDKLSNVSERYKPVEMFALKPESSDSETEQQG
jgi:hypothetical protein